MLLTVPACQGIISGGQHAILPKIIGILAIIHPFTHAEHFKDYRHFTPLFIHSRTRNICRLNAEYFVCPKINLNHLYIRIFLLNNQTVMVWNINSIKIDMDHSIILTKADFTGFPKEYIDNKKNLILGRKTCFTQILILTRTRLYVGVGDSLEN